MNIVKEGVLCRANVWAREAGRGRHSLQPRAAGKHFTKTGSGHFIRNTSILPRQARDTHRERALTAATRNRILISPTVFALAPAARLSRFADSKTFGFFRHTRSVVVRHAWRFGADTLMRKNWLACLRSRRSHSTSGRSGRTCAVDGRQSFSCSRPTAST